MGPFAGGYLSTRTWGTWDENASDERVTRKSRLAQRGREAKSNRWFEDLLEKLQKALEIGQGAYGKNPFTSFDWNRFQKGIDPMYGKLDEERSIRKRQQVENLLVVLTPLIKDRDVVVEFGAGSGHVALVLAALFPLCTFVLVDKKHQSLDIARERIAMAKLVNVQIVCGFIDDFKEQFDVGIALHACGEATDMALDKCVAMGASYVMAPCCVGKIKHSSLCYPRSKMVRTLLNREEYSVLAKAADFGHDTDALAMNCINEKRRRSKTFVEYDRNLRAQENGYTTRLITMIPLSATPKNDIVIGTTRHKRILEELVE